MDESQSRWRTRLGLVRQALARSSKLCALLDEAVGEARQEAVRDGMDAAADGLAVFERSMRETITMPGSTMTAAQVLDGVRMFGSDLRAARDEVPVPDTDATLVTHTQVQRDQSPAPSDG